ncbi:MAG TPA: ATP-binding protein [Candidatus Competibacteraceae bacterium]|nr:response regulator [Candidatus Competibacteraceae bacterium]HPF60107.1 ATP-binding protein [Candidatus Competibacteraceae bacterium]HRY19834.1 ATP-binding protein [Candidatus Competibacteraceae bacterium]
MIEDEKDRARILREKAEASAIQRQPEMLELSVEDARRLVHELQVHQIELELQNEELRRIMSDLEQSRNQFSLLFHRAPVGYLVLDEVGLIYEVNETFCRMLNQHRNQLIGNPFSECMEDKDRSVFLARYRAFFRDPVGKSLEASILRAKGLAFYAQMEGAAFSTPLEGRREKNAPLLLLAVTDINERKWAEDKRLQLERHMQQTQKLESLGVLAGGIAHDFNNLLTIILGNASLALDELPPNSPAHDGLRAIEKTSLRAAELCRQMLAYSGKGRFVIEDILLDDLIGEMVSLFKASISKKAILNLNLKESLPSMRGDPSQIRQVVMNLVINASEAIGEQSGVVTVSTGVMECTRDYLSEAYLNENLSEGTYIWLEISDTGSGMDYETQQRIFEPFFTTKFTGRGLGLSAVLGIVRGHRGALRVYSEPGQGTTFKVLFPIAQKKRKSVAQSSIKPSEWRGAGTVLLVDDEESVRSLGTRMLERIGFQSLVATDGQEALELYEARSKDIVLVLLDLTMPCMDGEEAFQHLRKINSKVRVVMTSGYTETEIAPRFAGKRLCGFLQKPYTLDTLTMCLRDVLGSN